MRFYLVLAETVIVAGLLYFVVAYIIAPAIMGPAKKAQAEKLREEIRRAEENIANEKLHSDLIEKTRKLEELRKKNIGELIDVYDSQSTEERKPQ